MTVDSSPNANDQPSQEGGAPWPELLLWLGQAVEALQKEEGFRAPEQLAAQPGVKDSWNWRGDLKETWAAVNVWREQGGQMPPRTQALVTALHMLLADLLLSAAQARPETGLTPAQIWRADTLADRLRLYYRLAAVGAPPGGGGRAAHSQATPLEDDEAQMRVARRWEGELLPMAVGLVLSEARLVVPYEVCQQLALRRVQGLANGIALSEQGRDTVRRVVEVLPEAAALLHERFRGIFREVEPSRWEYLKPDPEEVAMYVKARLYSQRPSPICLNRVREYSEPVEEDGKQAEEAFLKAFRALVAKNLQERLSKGLARLEEEMRLGQGQELLAVARNYAVQMQDRTSPRERPGGGPISGEPFCAGYAEASGMEFDQDEVIACLKEEFAYLARQGNLTWQEFAHKLQIMLDQKKLDEDEKEVLKQAIK